MVVLLLAGWQEKIEFWLKSVKRSINEEVTKQSKGKESDIPVDPGVCVLIAFLECLDIARSVTGRTSTDS